MRRASELSPDTQRDALVGVVGETGRASLDHSPVGRERGRAEDHRGLPQRPLVRGLDREFCLGEVEAQLPGQGMHDAASNGAENVKLRVHRFDRAEPHEPGFRRVTGAQVPDGMVQGFAEHCRCLGGSRWAAVAGAVEHGGEFEQGHRGWAHAARAQAGDDLFVRAVTAQLQAAAVGGDA